MESNHVLCRVNTDANIVIWNDATETARIAADIFAEMCKNVIFRELDDHWSTYNTLTVADRKIRLRPNTKLNICVLVQWVLTEWV